ncbi:MAG: hypothetical protein ABI700_30180 [Chloroflexota bacterium]
MKRRYFLAVASLILLIPQLLFAQDTTIEFYGTIQSANATAIVINGQIVDIQSAQVNAPLTAGTVVHVRATSGADGSFAATEIDPVTPGIIPGIVEIDGLARALNTTEAGSIIRVGDTEIDISEAEIRGTILPEQPVRVFARSVAPGKWAALLVVGADILSPASTPEVGAPVATPDVLPPVATPEVGAPVSTPDVLAPVKTPEAGEDFKITGTLQSLTDADLVVDGQRLFIGGARIEGTLTVGVQVQLEIRVVNGQWVLEAIKVVNGSDDNGSDDHGGSNSGSDGSSDDGSHGVSNSGGDDGGGNSGKGGGEGSGGQASNNSSSSNSGSDQSGKGD